MAEVTKTVEIKSLRPEDLTACESTAMMIAKARADGVETAFDRAAAMKPCPIGPSRPAARTVSWAPAA